MLSAEGALPLSKYFNSGIILVDVRCWREKRVFERALDLASRYPGRFKFHDQCLLNSIFHGDWLELPLRWNQQTALFEVPGPDYLPVGKKEFEEARLRPAVAHYTTRRKPWNGDSLHPRASDYVRVSRKLPGAPEQIQQSRALTQSAIEAFDRMRQRVSGHTAIGAPLKRGFLGFVPLVIRLCASNPGVASLLTTRSIRRRAPAFCNLAEEGHDS